MSCEKVLKQLSEFFDGMLDSRESVRISRHLERCEDCRRELELLSALHARLASAEKVQIPDYVYHLVKTRLKSYENRLWYRRLKDSAALWWSRLRTVGFQFYWTRVLGTVVAAVFFYGISLSIDPFYPTGHEPPIPGEWLSQEYREQFPSNMSRSLGGVYLEQYKEQLWQDPAINDLYYDWYMDSVPETEDDENLSVVFAVEANGTVKIENVLQQPEDETFLHILYEVFTSARGRPGSRNGKSVPSLMFSNFNWVTVFASADELR
jgi:hypothetical protein